jgi:hypothetical protein
LVAMGVRFVRALSARKLNTLRGACLFPTFPFQILFFTSSVLPFVLLSHLSHCFIRLILEM